MTDTHFPVSHSNPFKIICLFFLKFFVYAQVLFNPCLPVCAGFQGDPVVKNPSANAEDTGDMGLSPASGRSPGVGNGNLL